MKKKVNYSDAWLVLLCLYSVTTITQSWYPFPMNRIVIAGAILILAAASVKRAGKADWFVFGYLGLFGLYTTWIAKDKGVNLVDYIYYFTAFLQLSYFSHKDSWEELRDSAQRLDRFLGIIVVIDFVIILGSLLWPGCHRTHEYWGNKTYFFGFTNSVHTVSAGCCLAMTLAILYFTKRKFSLIHLPILGIYAYAVLESGARVFLVPVMILLFVYIHNRIENKRLMWILYGIGIPMLMAMLAFSGFVQKIMHQYAYAQEMGISFLTTFTNGRDVLWAKDIADFVGNKFIFQFLGNGFDYVYVLNYSPVTNAGVWAHNDFINILVCAGMLGLALYLLLLLRVYRSGGKMGLINGVMIATYVLFPAFMNGFYTYYHYFSSVFLLMVAINNMTAKDRRTV